MIPCLQASQLPAAAHDPLGDRTAMENLLARWTARGWLRGLDAAFAGFLWREVPDASPLLILAAALASHQLGRGHACLDLAATLADPGLALSLPPEGEDEDAGPGEAGEGRAMDDRPAAVLAGLTLADWQAALRCPQLLAEGGGDTPLVRVAERLYLRRYWRYEQDVRHGIASRLAAAPSLPPTALRATLAQLFSTAPEQGPDWQMVACALAARSAFSIVTGGPGTGKTTTVVRLLALLQALALSTPGADGAAPRPLRIRLAAPTGKAAARLNESISRAVAGLPLATLPAGEAVRAAIPLTVSTLHRLLGSRPDSRHFRHHAGHPLALDVLVIDEASMVDLEMMAAVLAALPPGARLILLGDKDQLASVEAGAVLGELCSRARDGHYTPATADWVAAATGQQIPAGLLDPGGAALDQTVAMLRHSHRFDAGSGIGQLAEAVNAGDLQAVQQVLAAGHADLRQLAPAREDSAVLRALAVQGEVCEGGERGAQACAAAFGYRHYLRVVADARPPQDAPQTAFDAWAGAVLQAHGAFQVLCALRKGRWGVEGLNLRIAVLLRESGLIPGTEGWYPGRPVLVTRNDYALGLMNGDIGVTLALPGAGGAEVLRVAFPAGDGQGGIRWVLPSRLQAVETVYALTVHKSQGSEFTHAALVLPESASPILTRELLYTGITRARERLTLVNPGGPGLLAQAVQRRVLRASGLLADDAAGEP